MDLNGDIKGHQIWDGEYGSFWSEDLKKEGVKTLKLFFIGAMAKTPWFPRPAKALWMSAGLLFFFLLRQIIFSPQWHSLDMAAILANKIKTRKKTYQ